MTKLTKLAADLEPFMIDLINKVVGDHAGYGADADNLMLGNVIRIRGTTVDLFDGDDDGFETANTGASSGDVILLPPLTFTSTLTITAGVKVVGWSRYSTNLSGTITGTANASLENLTLSKSANDANTIKGIINPGAGTFYINDCDIKVAQAGSGNAYAVSLDNNGSVELWNCFTYGNSTGGNGYAGFDGGGAGGLYFFGGRAYGSTDEFG